MSLSSEQWCKLISRHWYDLTAGQEDGGKTVRRPSFEVACATPRTKGVGEISSSIDLTKDVGSLVRVLEWSCLHKPSYCSCCGLLL